MPFPRALIPRLSTAAAIESDRAAEVLQPMTEWGSERLAEDALPAAACGQLG
jgi:hypothetical protein